MLKNSNFLDPDQPKALEISGMSENTNAVLN